MTEQSSSDEQHTFKLQRAASYASLIVACTLVAAKVWGWNQTASVSLLSSLIDSVLDVLASLITAVAVGVSLKPADSDHRFGHGKAEGLAALAQALIIAVSALYVLSEAVNRLLAPQPVSSPESGLTVMILSILLTGGLVLFQRSVVRRTGSLAINADSMHYRSDLLVNLSIACAIPIAAWTNLTIVDPLLGIAVAGYILWTTYEIATGAVDVLLDRELPDSERERIKELACSHGSVLGFHDLRTRSGGRHIIVQFHLELAPDTTLIQTHIVLDEVENIIRREFTGCEIIIHADPLGFEERRDQFD